MSQVLLNAIETRVAKVGIVGLGYVGLPLAHAFSNAGFPVLGFDVDSDKVQALADGEQYLDHLAASMFEQLFEADSFDATTDMDRLSECDAILIAVPTPLGEHQEPDLSYVLGTATQVGQVLRANQLIVLESTTYPGTTRGVFSDEILRWAPSDLVQGEHFHLAYSPEREDPGREMQTTDVPKLVGGLSDDSAILASTLYKAAFGEVVVVDSAEIAEAAKLLENIFRAVNIALVNELKPVLSRLEVDVWKVIDAAATKPYGFMPFYPGPGLGGHCIPIDPFYLSWRAREVGEQLRFIELAGHVNREMPKYVVSRLVDALNLVGKALSTCEILIVGLAYKAGVGDTRESPTYELIGLLQDRGAHVQFHDDLAPRTIPGRTFSQQLNSVPLSDEMIASFDAVVISTAHEDVPWQMIASHAQLVVDTRNAMSPFEALLGPRLIKA